MVRCHELGDERDGQDACDFLDDAQVGAQRVEQELERVSLDPENVHQVILADTGAI